MLSLPNEWIWDSWYVHDGQRWHGYFLKAPKSLGDPELRHWNVTQGHAVSDDLRQWEHLGTTFGPAPSPAWDDYTTWTGSVVGDDQGQWHLFYTGTSRSEDGLYQRIGHAVGTDLHTWSRVDDGLCLDLTGPVARQYEADHKVGFWHDRAMRDPWVMRDPGGEGWLMYFTARADGISDAKSGGAIGFATSPDLMTWTLQAPVWVGGFGQLEVPQVFTRGGTWYCLFCTAAEHWADDTNRNHGPATTGTHYLMGDSPRGPWRLPPGSFLDGEEIRQRYAARIIETADGLQILGFMDGRANNFGGYVMDPDPVYRRADGTLSLTV
ncbi:MAG: levansucrase [Pseudomonadota bacterium]